jgi:hypothetical protein
MDVDLHFTGRVEEVSHFGRLQIVGMRFLAIRYFNESIQQLLIRSGEVQFCLLLLVLD